MRDLLERLECADDLSEAKGGRGEYWAKQADNRLVHLKATEAKKIVAGGPVEEAEYLVIWWVPPEYVAAREQTFRIKRGWLKPLWDWERGKIYKGPLIFDGVVKE